MANEKQLKILKQGVNVWNEWRKSNPDVCVDFTNANLTQHNLVQANLRDCDLRFANLSLGNFEGANLSGCQLMGADLAQSNLTKASLSRSKLIGANLCGADLSKADLRSSDLSGVAFRAANLSNANLGRASLREASMSRANLTNVQLTGATLGRTTFAQTSLKTAKGLASCWHSGPSAIDYHTLMDSGRLPEVFLRGCGLSDVFINYLPEFWNEPIQFYSCFISYSHADKAFARRLHDALQGRGIRCWMDEHQLLPGDQIHRAVDEAVRLWDKVLLCCSAASLQSWWVDKEVQKALMKEEQLWKERGKETLAIIPLNLDGHLFSPEWKAKQDWKEQHLTTRLAADFTGWEKDNAKFESQLDRVVKALRADAAARPPAPKSKL